MYLAADLRSNHFCIRQWYNLPCLFWWR